MLVQLDRPVRRILWGIVTLLGIALALYLAQWQGGKADKKTALLALNKAKWALPAIQIDGQRLGEWSKQPSDVWRLTSVTVGAVSSNKIFYQWVGKEGQWGQCLYSVLHTPSGHAILAKLGWYAASLTAKSPLVIPLAFKAQKVWTGRLHVPERRWSLIASSADISVGAMDYVDILRLQKYEPLPLFVGVLELENQAKGCETSMPSEEMIQKHRSYQYQWYGLAILIGLLYGYYGFRR